MVKMTSKIKYYEKRFGIIGIEKGFISSEDLNEALKVQVGEKIEIGKNRLLGAILLYQDKITAIQIDDVVKTLFKQIKVAKKRIAPGLQSICEIHDFQDKITLYGPTAIPKKVLTSRSICSALGKI